jgi:hypothetical protein
VLSGSKWNAIKGRTPTQIESALQEHLTVESAQAIR